MHDLTDFLRGFNYLFFLIHKLLGFSLYISKSKIIYFDMKLTLSFISEYNETHFYTNFDLSWFVIYLFFLLNLFLHESYALYFFTPNTIQLGFSLILCHHQYYSHIFFLQTEIIGQGQRKTKFKILNSNFITCTLLHCSNRSWSGLIFNL